MDLATGNAALSAMEKGAQRAIFPSRDSLILFASTHASARNVRPLPTIHRVTYGHLSGVRHLHRIRQGGKSSATRPAPGYDAEATVSPTGDRIVFTSMRSGDLNLHSMDLKGGAIRQLTDEVGYDGGAFFSWTEEDNLPRLALRGFGKGL